MRRQTGVRWVSTDCQAGVRHVKNVGGNGVLVAISCFAQQRALADAVYGSMPALAIRSDLAQPQSAFLQFVALL